MFYWVWPCGIIQHGQPPKTKFYNAKVITKKFQDFSAEKKALFYTLIKLHFLNDKKETLLKELGYLENNALRVSQKEGSGDLSGVSNHPADQGTDTQDTAGGQAHGEAHLTCH